MMIEEWRAAPSTEGRYEVSSWGRVRNARTGRLVGSVNNHGYMAFADCMGSRDDIITRIVHREVCVAFHGAPPFADAQVRHLDGVKTNNSADNLAWGSAKDNADDRELHGYSLRGEGAPNAKLREVQVREIRRLAAAGETERRIASRFGVSPATAHRVISRKSWAHLPEEVPA